MVALASTGRKKSQSQPLRFETPEEASFVTSRCTNSLLWFVNNKRLEDYMLGHLARNKQKYGAKLYAYVVQGNHYHSVMHFPECNRAAFQRDFNSRYAGGVKLFVSNYPGGKLFGRRYSAEALPNPEDIEEMVFYSALQPVGAGLAEYPEHYPGYNSFQDAIWGIEKKVKVFRAAEFNERRRFNKNLDPEEFTEYFNLVYDRLPGYEDYSQEEYARLMLEKLEVRRAALVAKLKEQGHRFPKRTKLENCLPGETPKTSKKSTRNSVRPLVLTLCMKTRRNWLARYFSVYHTYKEAYKKFRAGNLLAEFPSGTYRPPGAFVAH